MAATGGCWKSVGNAVRVGRLNICSHVNSAASLGLVQEIDRAIANAAFIAAANPAAILSLLNELEDSHKAYALLSKECGKLRSALEEIKVKLITDDPLDIYDTVCDALNAVGAAKGEEK